MADGPHRPCAHHTLSPFELICCGQLAHHVPLVSCYLLHAVGRACFEGTNKALYADFFAGGDESAAFSNIVIANGLASAIAFFTYPEVRMQEHARARAPDWWASPLAYKPAVRALVLWTAASQDRGDCCHPRRRRCRRLLSHRGVHPPRSARVAVGPRRLSARGTCGPSHNRDQHRPRSSVDGRDSFQEWRRRRSGVGGAASSQEGCIGIGWAGLECVREASRGRHVGALGTSVVREIATARVREWRLLFANPEFLKQAPPFFPRKERSTFLPREGDVPDPDVPIPQYRTGPLKRRVHPASPTRHGRAHVVSMRMRRWTATPRRANRPNGDPRRGMRRVCLAEGTLDLHICLLRPSCGALVLDRGSGE